MGDPLLRISDVHVSFDTPRGKLRAVRGASFELNSGETLAIVGESGSGKSALARAIVQLNQPPFTPQRTQISGVLSLRQENGWINLAQTSAHGMNAVRSRYIAMIAQESLSGLNPVWRVGTQIREALSKAAPSLDHKALQEAVLRMIDAVGLPDAAAIARRYPHQLSGGQRQRVMISIAVIRSPQILIADEPTTALDVTVQARILQLLAELRVRSAMSMIFISHDLAVVAEIADRIAVMYCGELVEIGPTASLLDSPRHPYTRALLSLQPERRNRSDPWARLAGPVPDPMDVPQGCAFRTRCPFAQKDCTLTQTWIGNVSDGFRCGRAMT